MKNYLLVGFALCLSSMCLGQIDSSTVQNAVDSSWWVISNLNGDKNIINGVPDAVTGGLISIVTAFILRLLKLKKLIRQGKITKDDAKFFKK